MHAKELVCPFFCNDRRSTRMSSLCKMAFNHEGRILIIETCQSKHLVKSESKIWRYVNNRKFTALPEKSSVIFIEIMLSGFLILNLTAIC